MFGSQLAVYDYKNSTARALLIKGCGGRDLFVCIRVVLTNERGRCSIGWMIKLMTTFKISWPKLSLFFSSRFKMWSLVTAD